MSSEDSRPLAGLPPADRTLLVTPPLELAIAEVRFATSTPGGAMAPDVGLSVLNRLSELGVEFARIEPLQQNRLTLNLQAGIAPTPQVETGTNGWTLASADGSFQATVLPESVVFQTSKYERWSVALEPRLRGLYTAVGELVQPVVVNRIGLRYVNRFVDRNASNPLFWRDRLNRNFLGPISDERLGHLVKSAQQQIELNLGPAQGALLRYGPFVDAGAQGAISFLLDIDVFDATPIRFDPEEMVTRIEVLNRTAASLFQCVLEPSFLKALQIDEAAAAAKTEAIETVSAS
jgi:uncharacterized protein (TIGR04255 family)